MRTSTFFSLLLAALMLIAACSDSDSGDLTDQSSQNGSASGQEAISVSSDGDVSTFTIALDTTALAETETIPDNDDDYVENSTFTSTVNITYSDGGVSITGVTDSVAITSDGSHVVVKSEVKDMIYNISGETSDGSLKIYSSRKFVLRLSGVTLHNPTGAAINIQSNRRAFIEVVDGTVNTLSDGTSYTSTTGEDMKATLFSEGQMLFSGKGRLLVNANCKMGICSDDYLLFRPGSNIYVVATSGHGIKANDAIYVRGGVINVSTSGTAKKAMKSEGIVEISGGRTTLIATGGGTYEDGDASGAAGLKSDSTVTITDGTLLARSTGAGGKGIKVDQELNVRGGTVKAITTAGTYTYGNASASPKGIKADGTLSISGGKIQVRCSASEGIESKSNINITGGITEVYSSDDAINSKNNMTIAGGYVYAHSTGNDGIDSNQNLTINGGVVVAEGAREPECGLDAAEGYALYMNGGIVVAIGGNIQATDSSSKQASVAVSASTNLAIGLFAGDDAILSYTTPSSGGTNLMISCPSLQSGYSYTLKGGVTASGGSSFYGLTTGATLSGGSSTVTVTAASTVGSQMGGGGGAPGGGGRRW